jgi:hypothetical protein
VFHSASDDQRTEAVSGFVAEEKGLIGWLAFLVVPDPSDAAAVAAVRSGGDMRRWLGWLFFPNGVKRAQIIQMPRRLANLPSGAVLPNPNPKVPVSTVPVVTTKRKAPSGPISGGRVNIPPLGRFAFQAGGNSAPKAIPVAPTQAVLQHTTIPIVTIVKTQ